MAISRVTLLGQIHELGVEHLGELNLLLDALHLGPRTRSETIQIVSRMAGRSDRIPNPQLYLEIAKELGVTAQFGPLTKLTSLGERLWDESTFPPYDLLSSTQKRTVAWELLGHPDLAGVAASALRLFNYINTQEKVFRLGSMPLDESQCLFLEIIQALHMASVDGEYIVISDQNTHELRQVLGNVAAQSEEELWKSIQEANERAKTAEQYVVEYERRRLMSVGCDLLASSIERISQYDAKANYDVRSYEADGRTRYIEVKSSTNLRVEFFWSKGERDFAANMGPSYWIYFVPRSHELPNLRHSLTLIQNPHKFIGTQLSEEIAAYKVTLTNHIEEVQISMPGPDTAAITLATPL